MGVVKKLKLSKVKDEDYYKETYGEDAVVEAKRQGIEFPSGGFYSVEKWKSGAEKRDKFFQNMPTLSQRDVREAEFANTSSSNEQRRQGLFSNVLGSVFGSRW